MKKLIVTVIAGVLAGFVFAQDMIVLDEQTSDVEASADIGLYSAYVWRGQVVNDGLVAQPSLTVSKSGFSLNVWGNYNLDADDGNNDFGEVDFALTYTIPESSDNFDIDIGLVNYVFPGSDDDSTTEAFVSTIFHNIILTPVLSLYYDFVEADGLYGSLAVSQGFEFSDALSAEIGGSVGYGSKKYNEFYFGNAGGELNDYNVYISGNYELTENLSLGALLQYTLLGDNLSEFVEKDSIVWGGVSLSYSF